MAATTSESQAAAESRLEEVLSGADLSLSQELFDVLGLLDANASLRRALTDPSRAAEAKQGLVTQLIGAQVSAATLNVVNALVASRWSNERDLGDTLEHLAALAAVAVAERDGADGLDALQAQLLGFVDLVKADHDLLWAFEDRSATAQAKAELATKLVPSGSEAARSLITRAVTDPRGLRPTDLVERFAQVAARRQRRWIATVSATRPLTPEQADRLLAGLNALYGRDLRLNVVIDSSLVGGLRVEVGDEVVDATAATRLAELRRRMAG
ncbi:MAG: F0F1 ATP synthase subunit delta [Galactobacter sp.]